MRKIKEAEMPPAEKNAPVNSSSLIVRKIKPAWRFTFLTNDGS
jgi:hypothetical protein